MLRKVKTYLLYVCLLFGFFLKGECLGKEYYSIDSQYRAVIEKTSLSEDILKIHDEMGKEVAIFKKSDFVPDYEYEWDFNIDEVKWASRGHKLMAVQISYGEATDVKIIYYDDRSDKWNLVKLGPPIGYYFEASWVKEDKILVTYLGTEDEYGICVFNFERNIVTFFEPSVDRIFYDCQGIVFHERNCLKYGKMNFTPEKPKIRDNLIWLADKEIIKKNSDFVKKIAHFIGNSSYICGKDFYCCLDFLDDYDIPDKAKNRKYITLPLPTKNKGFAGLKQWTGYVHLYSLERSGFEAKGYEIATKELEDILKKKESDLMEQILVHPNEKKKVDIYGLQIEIKDISSDSIHNSSLSHLYIKIKKGQKSETINIGYLYYDDSEWGTPVILIEKEPRQNKRLLAIKYIDDFGVRSDIYTIKE